MDRKLGRAFLTNRYVVAVVAPVFLAGVMETTWPFFQNHPITPYLLAVILSASYGGLGSGLLTVAISLVLSSFFFIDPYFSFRLNKYSDATRLLIFSIVGVFITLSSELTHRASQRARINLESARRAERSLREKERFLNQIAELSPVVINVFDLAMQRDVYISPDVENLLGYTPQQITEIEDRFAALWHPEDISRGIEALARVKHARDGETAELEYRIRRSDGAWRWVASRIIPFERDDQGVVQQIIIVSVDITERKEAEIARRASQLQYGSLVLAIDGIVWEVDLETLQFTFVSNQAERILGYPVEQWLEPNFWADHLHPEDRDCALRFCIEATAQKRDHQFEYRMIAADGRVVWLRDIVTVPVFEDQPTRLSGLMVDITERKREESALRAAEQKYRDIFENSVEGIFQTTPDGRFIEVNPALARMFGFASPEEMIRERADISRQHYADAAKREELQRVLEEHGLVHGFEYAAYRKDGSVIWVSDNVRVVRNHDGIIYYEGSTQDITERKHAEDALRASEERYRELFENARDAVYVHDLQGRYTSVNRAAEKLLGYPREEIIGRHFAEFIAHEQIQEVEKNLARKLAAAGGTSYELELIARDGRRVPVEVSSTLIYENGVPVGVQGLARDITERRRAEKEIFEAQSKYQQIFENAGEGIFQSTPEGEYLAANPALARIHGFDSPEEFIATCRNISTDIYADSSREEFKRILAENGVVRGFEHQVFRKDGSKIWISVNARVVTDPQGNPLYYEGTAQDITERKRAEELLRTSEQRFRSLIENSSDAVALFTADGGIVYASPSTPNIIGYTPEELLSMNAFEVIHPEDSHVLADAMTTILKQPRMSIEIQGRVHHKEGSVRWLEGTFTNLLDEPGINAIVNNYRDITERNRAEERLREYEKVVEGLEEMIAVVDRDYRYLLANRAFLKRRGLKKENVVGKPVAEIVGHELFETVIKKHLDRCFSGRVVKYDLSDNYPEIGQRDLSVSYFPIEGPAGVDRAACVLQDITDRKQAEQRLSYHARLLEQVHDAIVAVDDRLTLTAWNRAAEQMYGWKADEVLGRNIRDVVRSDFSDAERADALRVVAEAGHFRSESIHRRKDGSAINIDGTIMALNNSGGGGGGYVFAYHDITERKRAEEALRRYSRRLIEAQETERQNIARELHDQIGQVLTAIRINLETIGKCGEGPDAQALLDEGVAIVDQALQQVRNLSFELRPSLLDDLGLASALRWYADRYSQRAGIRVTTKIEVPEWHQRLPREIETACFRIVQEALTNVARHARAKNVLIDLGTSNDGISLSIKDDGIGFEEHSLNGSSSTHFLGLLGMKERALAIGGKLEITSASSRGTQIQAFFPNGKKRIQDT